jgi:hypothetical protein
MVLVISSNLSQNLLFFELERCCKKNIKTWDPNSPGFLGGKY